MAQLDFKRGDTFILEATAKDGDTGKDLTGWTIEASARFANRLVCNFFVTFLDRAAGVFQITAPPTNQWPVGLIDSDIKYISPTGQVIHTETFQINCILGVTL